MVAKAGIAGSWTPRELRHTYVSILSDRGAPIELKPVITGGAELIDDAVSDWTWDLKGQNIG